MIERAYTISEIDTMREAAKRMFGFTVQPSIKDVEERLRTYMLNGTDPDELRVAGDAAWADSLERFLENRRVANKQQRAIEKALKPDL